MKNVSRSRRRFSRLSSASARYCPGQLPIERLEQRALFSTVVWNGGGTDNNWTDTANWVGNVAPSPGDSIQFSGTTRISPNNNETAGTSYASIEFVAGGFTLTGNQVSITSGITEDSGASTATISMPVALPTESGAQSINVASGTLTIGGQISGSNPMTKTGSGTLVISGANTNTGLITAAAGTVNVSGNETSATGGWAVGTSVSSTPITVSFQGGSTIDVASGNSIQIAQTGTTASAVTVNVAGTVTDSGSLTVGRDAVFNINSGADWTQNGSMSIGPGSNTAYNTSATVNTGGTFNYFGSSAISLSPSTSTSAGSSTLAIAGGTFLTGEAFSDTVSSSGGSSKLTVSSSGTVELGDNIASLLTTAGSSASISLPSSGAKFNTNGFNTSIATAISGSGILNKDGSGVLTLTASNSYTGGTYIATSSGALLAENSAALGTGTVTVVNGGTSNSSLQLSGGITITNNFGGFNSETAGNTPTIESLSGNNTVTGNLSITGTGGTAVILQSDAGTFTFSGGLTTTLTTFRAYYLQGAGNGAISGNITDDSSHILQVVESGTGTWTLTGTNTYAAGTTINTGTLVAHGSAVPGAVVADSGGTFNDSTIAGAPWTDTDIGSPALAGNLTFNTANTYTMAGSGSDITGASDQFNFAGQPVLGDGGITAEVNGAPVNTDSTTTTGSKDGIMFRDDLLWDSSFVFVGYTTGSGIQMLYRNGNGATEQVGGTVGSISGAVWLSLTRVQGVYTAAYSTDGTNFTTVATLTTDDISQSASAGFAICSHNTAKVATATFSSVSISNSLSASTTDDDLSFTVPWLSSSNTLVYAKTGTTWHQYANLTEGQTSVDLTGLTTNTSYTVELASATAVFNATGSTTGNTPPTLTDANATIYFASTKVAHWQVTGDTVLSEGISANTDSGDVTYAHEFVYASDALQAAQMAGIMVTNFESVGGSGTSTNFGLEVTTAGNTGNTAPAYEESLAAYLGIANSTPIIAVEDGNDADFNDAYADLTITQL